MTQHEQHLQYLHGLLAEARREYEARIRPIVDQLCRLENVSPRPNVFLVADLSAGYLAQMGKKEAPAGEDRGQGGEKETTTKNEPSV